LFENFTIIGPKLWEKIQNEPEFKNLKTGNATFKIPSFDETGKIIETKQEAKGKILQDLGHYLALWTYIKTNYNLDKAQIVDMNNKDKFIFWLYFAKVEEPIITIQSDKARLILKYAKGKLFFIEII